MPKDEDDCWIDDQTRTVSWTLTLRATVAIGHYRCSWCKLPTPDPTDSDIIEFVQNPKRDHRTLWPFSDPAWGPGRFVPPGWTMRDSQTGMLHLCAGCTIAYDAAVGAAKAARSRR